MKIDFTYRRPEERRKSAEQKPNPPAGTYNAKIYNVNEWTNKNTGRTKLFVNLSIGTDYAFGVPFNFNAENESSKDFAINLFSELLDACGVDANSFDDTDTLIGKMVTVTLEDGDYGLKATRFSEYDPVNRRVDTPPPASRYPNEPQESQFNYDKRPGFIDTVDNSNDEPPF